MYWNPNYIADYIALYYFPSEASKML